MTRVCGSRVWAIRNRVCTLFYLLKLNSWLLRANNSIPRHIIHTTHTCTHKRAHTYTHMYTQAQMRTHVHTCTNAHTQTHTHMHTPYTHTHTPKSSRWPKVGKKQCKHKRGSKSIINYGITKEYFAAKTEAPASCSTTEYHKCILSMERNQKIRENA